LSKVRASAANDGTAVRTPRAATSSTYRASTATCSCVGSSTSYPPCGCCREFATSESGGRFSVTAEQLDADLAWFGEQLIRAIAPQEEQRGARPGDCAQRGETDASTSAMKDM
jgi:hypothetical protein